LAQPPANAPNCRNPDLDVSIKLCTDMIQSGKLATADLALAYNSRGHDHVGKHEYDLGIADLSQAITIKFDVDHAHNTRGEAYAALGQYDLAIADFTIARKLDPTFAETPLFRARAYEAKGMRDQAIADYQTALQLQPNMKPAQDALARLGADLHAPGCRSADLDVSIAACTAIIQSGHDAPADVAMAYNIRGHDYVAKGQYDQGIADFTQAIAIKPDVGHAYNTRGRAEAAKGQYDLAIADYTKALTLDPTFAEIPYLRAAAYEHKGMRDLAVADYRAALKLKPDMKDAKDGLTRLGAMP
jgi:tetratricopeptide (TPR) repeat protein